ncbi:MAG: T9SS C-terminal target domain-containing protein [Bacteroidetes bacterium]|nr:MAG: T9SS C-terminal target domain-containing protein [Bacteroidota bacterium]
MLTEEDDETTFVYVYGFDEDGNYDYCTTYIQVEFHQDCGTTGGNLSGVIMTEDNVTIQDVEVDLNGDMSMTMVTPIDGHFLFSNLNLGMDYSVTPYHNADHSNGVTTFDIVKISQAILGVQPLDSPYKMIAADVNRSGTITTLDLIQIRKVILNVDREFANNTSWRFIPADYVFPDPTNPWFEPFPEVFNVNDLAGNLEANFVGIKIGDVNGSARANELDDDGRTLNGTFDLEMDELELKAGNTYTVPVYASKVAEISGFQGTLQLSGVELVDIVYGVADAQHFGLQFADQGVIMTSWDGQASQEEALFTLVLRATTDQTLSSAVQMTSRYTAAEAYSVGGEHRKLGLQFNGKAQVAEQFELYQNTPNPVANATLIGFYLPEAGEATLTIKDISGRTVLVRHAEYGAGYHTINLDRKELGAAGVLTYTLKSGEYTATKQMVVVK